MFVVGTDVIVAAFAYVLVIPVARVDVSVDTFATIVLVVVIGLSVVDKVAFNDEFVIFVPFPANIAFVVCVFMPSAVVACKDVFVDTFATIVLVAVNGLSVVDKVAFNDDFVIFVSFPANVAFVVCVFMPGAVIACKDVCVDTFATFMLVAVID